jgi:hypothetical protein
MSTTLAHLLLWRERLSEGSADEAEILKTLISQRETDIRSKNFRLISIISRQEEWAAFRTEAIARWAEGLPVVDLERVSNYLSQRMQSGVPQGEIDPLDCYIPEKLELACSNEPPMPSDPHAHLLKLYQQIYALEAKVTEAPSMTGGMQGVRVMRVVALMSQASEAQVSQRRISGLQASYQHA